MPLPLVLEKDHVGFDLKVDTPLYHPPLPIGSRFMCSPAIAAIATFWSARPAIDSDDLHGGGIDGRSTEFSRLMFSRSLQEQQSR